MGKNVDYQMAKARANTHARLYQYTTLDALKAIVSNRSLKFTRLDCVNDLTENRKISYMWKTRVFVSCFTHRQNESFFFWKSYPRSTEEGVRISFDNSLLQEFLFYPDSKCRELPLNKCDRAVFDAKFSPSINQESWGIYDFSKVDVAYIPRDRDVDEHQGRCKYIEWDMEDETRLRLAIRPRCYDYFSRRDGVQERVPEEQAIYARLSQECIESMTVTISPFAKEQLLSEITKLLEEHNLNNKVSVSMSVLGGEINGWCYK